MPPPPDWLDAADLGPTLAVTLHENPDLDQRGRRNDLLDLRLLRMNVQLKVSGMADRLRRVSVFAGLDRAALDLLAARARELKLAAGSVVVREGEPGNQFYAIDAGTVRVCKNFGGADEVELARFGQGQTFGEMSIVEPLPRSGTVQTVSAAVLLVLSSLDFLKLYEAMPTQYSVLILNIARELSRRLRRLDDVFAALH